MALLSADMTAEMRSIADAYVAAERRRIERSNRLVLAQRETSRREAEGFLSRQPGRSADLEDLLARMSMSRDLATVHVMRMAREGMLKAAPPLHDWPIPTGVTITLRTAA